MGTPFDPERLLLAAGPPKAFDLALAEKTHVGRQVQENRTALLFPLPVSWTWWSTDLWQGVRHMVTCILWHVSQDKLPSLWLVADSVRLMVKVQKDMYCHARQTVQEPAFQLHEYADVIHAVTAKALSILVNGTLVERPSQALPPLLHSDAECLTSPARQWPSTWRKASMWLNLPSYPSLLAFWVVTNPDACFGAQEDNKGAVHALLPKRAGFLDKVRGVLPAKWHMVCNVVADNIVQSLHRGPLTFGALIGLPPKDCVFDSLFNMCCHCILAFVADRMGGVDARDPREEGAPLPTRMPGYTGANRLECVDPAPSRDFRGAFSRAAFWGSNAGRALRGRVDTFARRTMALHAMAAPPRQRLTDPFRDYRAPVVLQADMQAFDLEGYMNNPRPSAAATRAAAHIFRWGALGPTVWDTYAVDVLMRFGRIAPDLKWHLPQSDQRLWYTCLCKVLTGVVGKPCPETASMQHVVRGALFRNWELCRTAEGARQAGVLHVDFGVVLDECVPSLVTAILQAYAKLGADVAARWFRDACPTLPRLVRVFGDAWCRRGAHDSDDRRAWLLNSLCRVFTALVQPGVDDGGVADVVGQVLAKDIEVFAHRNQQAQRSVAAIVRRGMRCLRTSVEAIVVACIDQLLQPPSHAQKRFVEAATADPDARMPLLLRDPPVNKNLDCRSRGDAPGGFTFLDLLQCLVHPKNRNIIHGTVSEDREVVHWLIAVLHMLLKNPTAATRHVVFRPDVLGTLQVALFAIQLERRFSTRLATLALQVQRQLMQGLPKDSGEGASAKAGGGASASASAGGGASASAGGSSAGGNTGPLPWAILDKFYTEVLLQTLRSAYDEDAEGLLEPAPPAAKGHLEEDMIGARESVPLPQGVVKRMTRSTEYTVDLVTGMPYGIEAPARRRKTPDGGWVAEYARTDTDGRHIKWEPWAARRQGGPLATPSRLACEKNLIVQTGGTCYLATALNILFTSALTQEMVGLMLHAYLLRDREAFGALAQPMPSYFRVRRKVNRKRKSNILGNGGGGSTDEDDTRMDLHFINVFLKVALRVLCRTEQAFMAVTQLLEVLGRKDLSSPQEEVGGESMLTLLEFFSAVGLTSFVSYESFGEDALNTPPAPVDIVITTKNVPAADGGLRETKAVPSLTAPGGSSYLVLGGSFTQEFADDAHSLACLQCPDDGARVVHDPNKFHVVPFDWLHAPAQHLVTKSLLGKLRSDRTSVMVARHMVYINADLARQIRTPDLRVDLGRRLLDNALASKTFLF